METRNRAEAERAIRENRKLHKAPDEIETRMDTVGRSKQKRVKSLIENESADLEAELNSTEHEDRPPETALGATNRSQDPSQAMVAEDSDEDSPPSAAFTSNDDMAGQGWTPPTDPNSGWQHPQEPAPEEQLHEEAPEDQ